MSFQQKMETIQYNAALAITGAIRGSSREKTLPRIRFRDTSTATLAYKTLLFYKILKPQSLKYLYSIIPIHIMSYRTRQCNKISAINVKHDFFKNILFPSTIIDNNNLILLTFLMTTMKKI